MVARLLKQFGENIISVCEATGKCAVNDMLVSMFQNGFAVVRPPGHHADPSNPM